MKPIYNKTGLENLLELIKKDNPSAVITSEQILEVPISGVDPVSGRTTAVLTAKVDGGYSGQITIDWLRRSLDQYVTEGEFTLVLDGETEEDVKAKIAETYSLVLSDLEFQGFSLPGLTENQVVVFSLQANEGLVYGETGSVSLIISTVGITEGGRGNGSTLRITSTGLVRGVVAGSDESPEPLGLFYGGDGYDTNINTVTRINSEGSQVGSETNAGTARSRLAGASVGGNGLFYGGRAGGSNHLNIVTRINSSGALAGGETNAGKGRSRLAGASVGGNGLFYGGSGDEEIFTTVTRINSEGALAGNETNVGTPRTALAGAAVGGNGLFYGGGGYGYTPFTVARINSEGALAGNETNVGTWRHGLAGAAVGGNGLFYGGFEYDTTFNTLTRINSSGNQVGSETTVGTERHGLAGAAVGGNGLFYGGYTTTNTNIVTRINANGTLAGAETNVGTARQYLAGASL